MIVYGVDELHVSDRALHLANHSGDALVTLAAQTHGPLHRGAFADLVFPVGTYFGKVVGKDVSCATSVGTMDNNDGLIGQVDTGICLGESGIIPRCNLAQENIGE